MICNNLNFAPKTKQFFESLIYCPLRDQSSCRSLAINALQWNLRDVQKAPVKTGMKWEVRLQSQVLYGVGSSDSLRPRAMPRRPVMAWGSVGRGVHRRSIELRNHRSGAPTLLDDGEGNMSECAKRVLIRLPGVRDLWHVHKLHEREPKTGGQVCS